MINPLIDEVESMKSQLSKIKSELIEIPVNNEERKNLLDEIEECEDTLLKAEIKYFLKEVDDLCSEESDRWIKKQSDIMGRYVKLKMKATFLKLSDKDKKDLEYKFKKFDDLTCVIS